MNKLLSLATGQQPLHRAVRSGDLTAVRLEVQKGAGVDQKDKVR
jgi:hypothetical protein